jgi:hypothetical protein
LKLGVFLILALENEYRLRVENGKN